MRYKGHQATSDYRTSDCIDIEYGASRDEPSHEETGHEDGILALFFMQFPYSNM